MSAPVVRSAETLFDSLPTFAAAVATMASGRSGLPEGRMIDFGGVNLQRWVVGKEPFTLSSLEDKIVFIGDMGDLRDWHSIPAGVGGQSRMSGLEIHALSAAALLSPNPYRTLPRGLGIALQVLLLFGFCWLLFRLPQTMDNWIQGALQIVFMVLMLLCCYLLFLSAHVVCSPTIAIIGFGLAGFAKNIVDAVFKPSR